MIYKKVMLKGYCKNTVLEKKSQECVKFFETEEYY